MSDFISRINPFYKFVFIIVFSTVITFIHSLWLNIWVFGVAMLLILTGVKYTQYVKVVKFLLPVAFISFSLFVMGLFFGEGSEGMFGTVTTQSTQTGITMATRFLSFAGIGLVFALTTNPYDLVKSLRKDAKLPRKFAYGMLCAVNLLPYIKTEYQNAIMAFRVRGVRVGVLSIKPLFSMLVNAFRWSEVLSLAMISKGFYEE